MVVVMMRAIGWHGLMERRYGRFIVSDVHIAMHCRAKSTTLVAARVRVDRMMIVLLLRSQCEKIDIRRRTTEESRVDRTAPRRYVKDRATLGHVRAEANSFRRAIERLELESRSVRHDQCGAS